VLRQDYIGRLIQQLIEAFGRAIARLDEQDLDAADSEIDAAERSLGLPRGIELFDARSAALVIGNGDKVVLAALLLEHRARVLDARGAGADARRKRQRALALLEHAKPHELREQADALRARLGA
jgi:hypothetical protein